MKTVGSNWSNTSSLPNVTCPYFCLVLSKSVTQEVNTGIKLPSV